MPSIAIIGIGNILFSDDGAGVYTVKLLEQNYTFSPHVDLIDGGTLGFKLLDLLQSYEKVIIIDTISSDDKVGTVFTMPASELCELATLRQTAHEVEVVEMLKMAELFESSAQVTIIGIVPEDIDTVRFYLSGDVESQVPLIVEQVCKVLKRWGVESEHNVQKIDCATIVRSYQEDQLG